MKIETPEEFAHAVIGIVRTTWTPYDQIKQMLAARDALLRADERRKAAEKKAELLDAAKAYRDLCACYRIGKQPTEKLFSRLEKANAAIMAEEVDRV